MTSSFQIKAVGYELYIGSPALNDNGTPNWTKNRFQAACFQGERLDEVLENIAVKRTALELVRVNYKVGEESELQWLLTCYGFLMCGDGQVYLTTGAFGKMIRRNYEQSPRNIYAANLADYFDQFGEFQSRLAGSVGAWRKYTD